MQTGTEEANEALVRRVVDEVINKGNVAFLREVCTPDYVWHPGDVAPTMDLDMHIIDHEQMHTAFPDMHQDITSIAATGDTVTTRFTMKGTHRGPLVDRTRGGRILMATGKPVTWSGVVVHRIVNGKIEEGWLNYDRPGFEEQIGLLPLVR